MSYIITATLVRGTQRFVQTKTVKRSEVGATARHMARRTMDGKEWTVTIAKA